jgi:hypothetical protein
MDLPKFAPFKGGIKITNAFTKIEPNKAACKNFDETFSKNGTLVIPEFIKKPMDQLAATVGAGGSSGLGSKFNDYLKDEF